MRLFKGIFAVILGFYATVILALLLIFLTTNLILLTN